VKQARLKYSAKWPAKYVLLLETLCAPYCVASEPPGLKGENVKMEYAKIERNEASYLKITSGQIREERDAIAMISACVEHGADRLLLPDECLSDDFFRLSSQVAGLVLQKLAVYGIKTAAVVSPEKVRGKFKDFLVEADRGNMFRAFDDCDKAERWLL
jgi:hypothetical protein